MRTLCVALFVLLTALVLGPVSVAVAHQASPEASPEPAVCQADYLGPRAAYGERGEGTQVYRFFFPADSVLEEMLYEDTVVAVVETGSIQLTVGDDVFGEVAVNPGPGSRFIVDGQPGEELDSEALTSLEPGQVVELSTESVVFQRNAVYSYHNVDDADATLIVTLVAQADGLTPPSDGYLFPWCGMIAQAEFRSAKRLPAIMCGGG